MKTNKVVYDQEKSREAIIVLAQLRFGINTESNLSYQRIKSYQRIRYTNNSVCDSAIYVISDSPRNPLRILARVIFSLSLYQYILGNISTDEMKHIISRFLIVDRMYWEDRNDYRKMINLK